MEPCPVILLADRSRPNVKNIASQLQEGLSDVALFLPEEADQIANATLAIAIGGDGTLINHGRIVSAYEKPLIGVNSGNLGFLAKFDAASLIEHRHSIFTSEAPTMNVILLEVTVDGNPPAIAMNEAMIAAGSPFRILELGLAINDIPAPTLRGDGIIVSTPIGSTAHNASVGGPIVDPSAQAFVLTPLAAHSLAVRPIVLDAHNVVTVEMLQANEGTSLVIDGDVHCSLQEGMKMQVKRSTQSLSIVLNPSTTYWNTLVDKLHWAAPPG
jgi:NAD+ kinase